MVKIQLDSQLLKHISIGLLVAAGGVLATPLAAGPLVLLALASSLLMLVQGWGGLQPSGQSTIFARNVLLIAFGSWFMSEFISTAINNQYWQNLDYPLRFLIAVGVFWVLRNSGLSKLEWFVFGIAASAFAAVLMGVYQHTVLEIDRSLGWLNNPIYFGNLSILLSLFAMIALLVLGNSVSLQLRVILALSVLLLVIASYLSISRSSWLGLLALIVFVEWNQSSILRLFSGAMVLVLGAVTIMIYVPEVSSALRIAEAINDVQRILAGDYRSAIGDRLQLWNAALLTFWSSPLIGIGSGQFQAEATKLVLTGAVNLELANGMIVYNQAHSEVMDVLATKGLLGLIAYMLLLFLPFRLFRRLAKSEIVEARAFALMGQATIIAFLMFGLTLATFKVQIYCAVFPVLIALFAAMSLNLSEKKRQ